MCGGGGVKVVRQQIAPGFVQQMQVFRENQTWSDSEGANKSRLFWTRPTPVMVVGK